MNSADIKRVLVGRGEEVSDKDASRLKRQAAVELARRSVTGAIVVPLCYVLVTVWTGYMAEGVEFFVLSGAVLAGSAVLRIIAIQQIKKDESRHYRFWLRVFYFSCIAMSAVWGLTTAHFIFLYNYGFPVLLVVMLSVGIGAGTVANFCIWRSLAEVYLVLCFGPGVIVGLLMWNVDIEAMVISLSFFMFYMLSQIRYWNNQYWNSLITTFLFEEQAGILEKANSNLVSTVEQGRLYRERLETSKREMRDLFDFAKNSLLICDLEGKILDVNLTMLSLCGLEKKDVLKGYYLATFATNIETAELAEREWQKVGGEVEVDFDWQIKKAPQYNPHYVKVNLRQMILQDKKVIFVTISDINEQKRTHLELDLTRKSLAKIEGYFQAILRNIELPIFCKDLNGRYITVNSSFELLCNISAEEIRGKRDVEVFSVDVARFFSAKDEHIAGTEDSFESEGFFTLDGMEKNLLIHKFPLKDSGGVVYGIGGICTDVTTMKKAFQAAQIATEAKTEFLANMSHELRTPMHSILSFARLGMRKADTVSREKREYYFKMIIASGEQLLELLNDLLELSTLESGHMSYSFRQLDLIEDIGKIVMEFKGLMEEKGIIFKFDEPEFPVTAMYDNTKIYQVLRNLLANALKFTEPGREVNVCLERAYMEKNESRQAAWKVMVVDQGVGIEKEELVAVFGKFMQGSKIGAGTEGKGLGLAICKRIIEDHDGAIWAQQNRNRGTSVCFLLPDHSVDLVIR